jgi:hypothetical protein
MDSTVRSISRPDARRSSISPRTRSAKSIKFQIEPACFAACRKQRAVHQRHQIGNIGLGLPAVLRIRQSFDAQAQPCREGSDVMLDASDHRRSGFEQGGDLHLLLAKDVDKQPYLSSASPDFGQGGIRIAWVDCLHRACQSLNGSKFTVEEQQGHEGDHDPQKRGWKANWHPRP